MSGPKCTSAVLAEFWVWLDGELDGAERQRLVPLTPGTVDPAQDQADGLRCAHWLVAQWLPAWLDLVPDLQPHAAGLRAIPAPGSWDEARQSWTRAMIAARRSWVAWAARSAPVGGVEERDVARDAVADAVRLATCAWAAAQASAGGAAAPWTLVRGVVANTAWNAAETAWAADPVRVARVAADLRQQTIDLYVDLVTLPWWVWCQVHSQRQQEVHA